MNSTYWLIRNFQRLSLGKSSNTHTQAHFWKMNKVKIFAWRVCWNGLPTYLNLGRKHVDVNGNCVFYQYPLADLPYAILFCPDIRAWWNIYLPILHYLQLITSLMEVALLIKRRVKLGTQRSIFLLLGEYGTKETRWFMNKLTLTQRVTLKEPSCSEVALRVFWFTCH